MTRFAKIRQLLSRPSHIGPWGKGTYKAMRWGIFKTSQLNKLILKNPKTSQIYHLNKSSLSGLSYAEEGSDWRRAKQLLKDLRNKIKLLKEKKLGLLSICMLNSHRNWKFNFFFFFFFKAEICYLRRGQQKQISLNREGSFKKVLGLRTKSIRGEGFLTLCENYSLLSSDLPSLKRSNHCILHLSSTWREQCRFQLRMSFKYISTLQYMLYLEIPCDKMGNIHVISPAFQKW